MDHIDTLGPSIDNIAWHKSGIYKPGAVALSTVQDPAPASVLEKRARDKHLEVRFVDEDKRLPADALQLKPAVQKKNSSLAIAAAEAWLHRKAPPACQDLSEEDIRRGVTNWFWPGRFQIILDRDRVWFVDAAHNEMSVKIAAQWFAESGAELDSQATRMLIFSHISKIRDEGAVLKSCAKALRDNGLDISHVIFSTYDESTVGEKVQGPDKAAHFHDIWKSVFPDTKICVEPTIRGAIELVKRLTFEDKGGSIQTLVTGSQHLVGPALTCIANPLN